MEWLCLAAAVLGVLALVSAVIGPRGSDGALVLYTLLIIGGTVGFLVLR